jgi:hypothetical protein
MLLIGTTWSTAQEPGIEKTGQIHYLRCKTASLYIQICQTLMTGVVVGSGRATFRSPSRGILVRELPHILHVSDLWVGKVDGGTLSCGRPEWCDELERSNANTIDIKSLLISLSSILDHLIFPVDTVFCKYRAVRYCSEYPPLTPISQNYSPPLNPAKNLHLLPCTYLHRVNPRHLQLSPTTSTFFFIFGQQLQLFANLFTVTKIQDVGQRHLPDASGFSLCK